MLVFSFSSQDHAVCVYCVLFQYCAYTLQEAMRRRAAGIWSCKGCRKVVAGGAYVYW